MYFGLVPARRPDGQIIQYHDKGTVVETPEPTTIKPEPAPEIQEKPKKRHWWSR